MLAVILRDRFKKPESLFSPSPPLIRIETTMKVKFPRLWQVCGLTITLTLIAVQAHTHAAETDLLSQPGPTFTVPTHDIPAEWTIIAYGDTRFTNPQNVTATNPKVRRWLVDKIAQEHPDALLISGDLPYNGASTNDYDVFRSETAPWRAAALRVYPALGNHELNGGEFLGLRNWWAEFPTLNHRRWYSVQFGKVYVIALDSDTDLTPGTRQQLWLADQFAHLPRETQFVMIELHHPPVADTLVPQLHLVRTNESALAIYLNSIAPKLHARLIVIAGHIHNYERFQQGNVTYLVDGGGGAKPYPVTRDPEDLYKNPPAVNYNYIRFHFDGTTLSATMFRVDADKDTPIWDPRDSFTVAAP